MITGKRVPLKDSAALVNTGSDSCSVAPWTALAVPTFLMLMACAHAAPKDRASTPLEVKITNLPERTQVTCWLPDVPEPPAFKELDYEQEDVMKRTMVHWIDFNALVQYEADLRSWAEEAQRCFNRLTGVEE